MVKNWLFGKKRKEDADALSTLKGQQNRLQAEARNLERQSDEQKILASKMLKKDTKNLDPNVKPGLRSRIGGIDFICLRMF